MLIKELVLNKLIPALLEDFTWEAFTLIPKKYVATLFTEKTWEKLLYTYVVKIYLLGLLLYSLKSVWCPS